MKVACLGLILLASVACAAADNRRLLQDGFNPLDALLNKNNTFDKIGKDIGTPFISMPLAHKCMLPIALHPGTPN
jgi:hypothetical protein